MHFKIHFKIRDSDKKLIQISDNDIPNEAGHTVYSRKSFSYEPGDTYDGTTNGLAKLFDDARKDWFINGTTFANGRLQRCIETGDASYMDAKAWQDLIDN